MTVGEQIKKLREQIGLGQGELAKASGVSQGYLSQVENGDVKSISLRMAAKLAEELGVSIDGLMSKEQTKVVVFPGLLNKITSMSITKQKSLLAFLTASGD